MLILSRKVGETVMVGDLNITVTVMGVSGNTVKLGFQAPPGVKIYREEIKEAMEGGAVEFGRDEGQSDPTK